ncbi:DUF4143 domain-containing protein [Thermus albus]|uniref:DUF4143 domain-containing protein n=1 Tax=Thermus albus TaxID=2908146 RepID=UPI00311AB673
MYLMDSGLAAHLLGFPAVPLEGTLWGQLLEGFVVGEVLRLQAAQEGFRLYHYREAGGLEADLRFRAPAPNQPPGVSPRGSGPGGEGQGHPGPSGLRPLGPHQRPAGSPVPPGGILCPGEGVVAFGRGLPALSLGYFWL